MSIAQSGMAAAVSRLEASARNIARWNPAGELEQASTGQVPAPPLAPAPSVDLAFEMVEQIQTLHAFKANVRTFETADEVARTLLDIVR